MKTVAIYTRVSTAHQVEDGFSLDAQKDRLIKLAESNNYKIFKIYEELGKSGKNINRPAFQEMMNDLKQKRFNKILIMKLDRISRSVSDLELIIKEIQKYNCGFESASEKIDTSSSMGLMFVRLLGVFAQFERERIAERITDAFVEKVKQGNALTNSLPLGYILGTNDKGEKIVVKNKELGNLGSDMFNFYIQTNSLRKTADMLMKKYPGKLSNYLKSGQGLSRAMNNTMYYGQYRDNLNYCEPYITKEIWDKVQEIKKNKNIKGYKHLFLFSGMLKSSCGHYLVGHFCHGKNTYRCKVYSTTGECDANSVVEYIVEKEFIKILKPSLAKFISNIELLPSKKKKIDIQKKITMLELKKKKVANSYINNWLTEDEANDEINKINIEIKKYQETSINDIDISKLKEIVNSDFETKYNNLSPESKQSFIRNLNIDYLLIDHNVYNSKWRDRKEGFLTIVFK